MVIRLNEGVAFLETGNFERARINFEKVVGAPNVHYRIRAYANLAILHFEQRDYVLADQAADAVSAANSNYRSSLFQDLAIAIHGLVALVRRDGKLTTYYGEALKLSGQSRRVTLDEDTYVLSFIARLLVRNGESENAIAQIDEALGSMAGLNQLAGLRLQCEKAEILALTCPDQAFALAKRIVAVAETCGAAVTRNRAQEVVTACRVQV